MPSSLAAVLERFAGSWEYVPAARTTTSLLACLVLFACTAAPVTGPDAGSSDAGEPDAGIVAQCSSTQPADCACTVDADCEVAGVIRDVQSEADCYCPICGGAILNIDAGAAWYADFVQYCSAWNGPDKFPDGGGCPPQNYYCVVSVPVCHLGQCAVTSQ